MLLAGVNAKYIHTNLALYSLKQYVEEHWDGSVEIEAVEYTINQLPDTITKDIYRRKPDVLAFSSYIWNISVIRALAENLGKILPEADIWLGGPEASCDADGLMDELPALRGIMTGEGEETFLQLCRYYAGELASLAAVPGIVARNDAAGENASPGTAAENTSPGTVGKKTSPTDTAGKSAALRKSADENTDTLSGCLRTAPPAPVDMDELPFVYEDLAPFEGKILYYETSRGCPFGCSYCLSSLDRAVRLRSLQKVERELQYFLDSNVRQVKLVDRTFNCNAVHAEGIWRYLRDHDNGVTNFHFEIEGDLLTREQLELLSTLRPGLARFEIGVQSTNQETLLSVNRRASFEKIAANIAAIRAMHSIELHVDLIAGLPYEGPESFRRSFDMVYALGADELQLGFLKLLKGTRLRAEAAAYGIAFRSEAPYEVLYTREMSPGDLFRLKDAEEMLEVYSNSRQFTQTTAFLASCYYESGRGYLRLFEDLAAWYQSHGLKDRSFSRMQRAEILRYFCHSLPDGLLLAGGTVGIFGEEDSRNAGRPADREGRCVSSGSSQAQRCAVGDRSRALAAMDERLLMDLYLREKVKVRPAWAEDWKEQKEAYLAFYKAEEKERRYLPHLRELDHKQLSGKTHVEVFRALGKVVLFDYTRRDPLSGNAVWTEIPETYLNL